MQGKKRCILLLGILMLCLLPVLAGAEGLRGYVKGEKYQYVQLGRYPYEADGTEAPVLWRVLDVTDGKALLLTEHVIDTQQAIFEKDKRKIEKGDYRRIASYEESDLFAWLNTTALETLMGEDPLRDALVAEANGSKLFILNMEEFLNRNYGFAATRWSEQPSRQAKGTPYAIESRGLYVDRAYHTSCYWVATIKGPKATHLALVGYNGHISWGGYTRQNVGLRLSVRLDMSQVEIIGGAGTAEDPFLLAHVSALDVASQEVSAPVQQSSEEAVVQSAEPIVPPSAPAQETDNDSEVLLSFIGDCSLGDSFQYMTYGSSYHTTLREKGYAWPFSLVKEYLAADDLTVANLEVVFTTRRSHSKKRYNLIGKPEHVNALLEGSIDIVNTANNHCMDFNRAGYQDTLDTLKNAGIPWFGCVNAGRSNGFDDYPAVQVKDILIGFIGISYPQEADKKNVAKRIKILKEEKGCDLVVVSLHWGRETHMTPNNGQVPFAKTIIDSGADVIWGHHPHVIQPIQFYKGKPIMYSTGNFTFGTMSKVDPSTGIFQLTYEKVDGKVQLKQMQVIPCKTQSSPDFRPMVLTDEAERKKVFKKLVWKKQFKNCVNPPESFLETGIIRFENGEMLP